MAIPSRRHDYQSVATDFEAGTENCATETDTQATYRRKWDIRFLCSPPVIASVGLCLAIALTIYVSKPILDQINEKNVNKHYDFSAVDAYEKLNGQLESRGKKGSSPISVSLGCEGTVMIIRHCEKYMRGAKRSSDFQHCNYVGFERAHYLATLFGNDDERWPAPSFIYSMGSTKIHHHIHREVETVTGISKKLQVRWSFTIKLRGLKQREIFLIKKLCIFICCI